MNSKKFLNPRKVVDGEPVCVDELLRKRHAIPAYQRDYVWQKRHVEQLWDDLFEYYYRLEKTDKLDEPDGYFLGAMVVIHDDSTAPIEVVDGQQRLTTLSTVVRTLLDSIGRLPPPSRALSHTLQSLLGLHDGISYQSNLSFSESDNDLDVFFKKSCVEIDSVQARKLYWDDTWCKSKLEKKRSPIVRLRDALEIGSEKLQGFLSNPVDDEAERLVKFIRLVIYSVVVLKITASSYESAYEIFESLNNRSVQLSEADLVKNVVLKLAAETDREEIIENWSETRDVSEQLDGIGLPEVLHYSELSRYGHVKAKKLFASIKQRLTTNSSPRIFSKELLEDTNALQILVSNPSSSWTQDTNWMLKDIRRVLNTKLIYPYLVSAYRQYDDQPVELEKHVKLAMNFSFRFITVCGGSIEAFSQASAEAAQLLHSPDAYSKVREKFLKLAPDSEFIERFKEFSASNAKIGYFCCFYLEKVRLSGVIPIAHGLDQNLEHIMPKTPSAKYWPDLKDRKTREPAEYKRYLWRIGNLLPLPGDVNKSLQNKDIAYKISNGTGNDYDSTSLISPREIKTYLDHGQWNYDTIAKRQHELAKKYAAKAWAI
jgi:Protein of unknown function DUF262/Protein of unknown function (DUF1524)